MKLTAELIEAFAGMYLSPRYDHPVPVAPYHRDCWKLYVSDHKQCMVAAPRGHAKSTALSFVYIMAEVLFRSSDYVIFIGSTEENAAELASNIYEELHTNDELIHAFGPFSFETDNKLDCVVAFPDGHRFRIIVKSTSQRIRGKMWNGKRPNLIVCDDMEEDEQVENKDRRAKFSRWFFRAAKQTLSKSGKIRIHGTILHKDSLLSRLRKNGSWKTLIFKAHASFDDFTDILWPEQWPEDRLRAQRQEFIDEGDAAGYSQEYLNDPQDNSEAYLKKEDFIPMSEEDYFAEKMICASADFAVSKADKANRTSFTIGGKCQRNLLHFIDQRVGRWNTLEWVDEMFAIQLRWKPEVFWVEDGVIWKGIAPTVYSEMQKRNIWLNLQPRLPVKDKATRGRSLQKRMRAGGCRFDKDATWYPGFEDELLHFTGYSEATLDDQFDSAALLSLGFEDLRDLDQEDFMTEEELEFERQVAANIKGRNAITGY